MQYVRAYVDRQADALRRTDHVEKIDCNLVQTNVVLDHRQRQIDTVERERRVRQTIVRVVVQLSVDAFAEHYEFGHEAVHHHRTVRYSNLILLHDEVGRIELSAEIAKVLFNVVRLVEFGPDGGDPNHVRSSIRRARLPVHDQAAFQLDQIPEHQLQFGHFPFRFTLRIHTPAQIVEQQIRFAFAFHPMTRIPVHFLAVLTTVEHRMATGTLTQFGQPKTVVASFALPITVQHMNRWFYVIEQFIALIEHHFVAQINAFYLVTIVRPPPYTVFY